MNTGGKERPHYRTSKTGKIFKAGTGPGSLKNTIGIDIDYVRHLAKKTFGAKKFTTPKKPKPVAKAKKIKF
jgi:hypothetical protein